MILLTAQLPVLVDIALLFAVAIVVIFICNLLRIPYIVGYLITGILVSPNSFSMITDTEEVNEFAEIGVILLLFTVGLEFSFSNLMKIKRYVLQGGSLQILLTISITTLLIVLMGRSLPESVVWGFVIALSSTAIVVKILQDRMEINTPKGKGILAILLFQDIAVVPLMLLIPILAGKGGNVTLSIIEMVGKLVGVALLAFLAAKYVVPPFLKQVMKIRNNEIFLIAVILIVISITLLTQWMGLSLALGAFIAGLIISESDYNQLAISCILPFRYVFISFFFISMGMLLDYRIFIEQPLLIGFWFCFIVFVKISAGFVAAKSLKLPVKTALMIGLGLAQIGEFSFILAKESLGNQLISEINYQIFLAVAILTMALAPFILHNLERITGKIITTNTAN